MNGVIIHRLVSLSVWLCLGGLFSLAQIEPADLVSDPMDLTHQAADALFTSASPVISPNISVEDRTARLWLGELFDEARTLFIEELSPEELASPGWALHIKRLALEQAKAGNHATARRMYRAYFEFLAPVSESIEFDSFPFELATLRVHGTFDETNEVWYQTDKARQSIREIRASNYQDSSLVQSLSSTYPKALQLPYVLLRYLGPEADLEGFQRVTTWLHKADAPQFARIALLCGLIRNWKASETKRPELIRLLQSTLEQDDLLLRRFVLASLISYLDPFTQVMDNQLLADAYEAWSQPLNSVHGKRYVNAHFIGGNFPKGIAVQKRFVDAGLFSELESSSFLIDAATSLQASAPKEAMLLFQQVALLSASTFHRSAGLYGLGSIYHARGDHENALKLYSESFSFDPENAPAARMFALYSEAVGDWSASLEGWKSLDHQPGIIRSLHELGQRDQVKRRLEAILFPIQSTLEPLGSPRTQVDPGLVLQWVRYQVSLSAPFIQIQTRLESLSPGLANVGKRYLQRLDAVYAGDAAAFWKSLGAEDFRGLPAHADGYIPKFSNAHPQLRAIIYQVIENDWALETFAKASLLDEERAPWVAFILGRKGNAAMLPAAVKTLDNQAHPAAWQLACAGLVCLDTSKANEILEAWIEQTQPASKVHTYRQSLVAQLRSDRANLIQLAPDPNRPF